MDLVATNVDYIMCLAGGCRGRFRAGTDVLMLRGELLDE